MRDAIRRQQKCFKSGAPAEVIKEWKFQKQMGFLQPYMANKSREGNLREHSETENQTQDFETDVEAAEVDNENIEQVNTQQSVENVEDESQPQTLSETVPTMLATTPKSLAPPRKKMKKDNVTTLLKESIEKHEERSKARTEDRQKLLQELQTKQNDPLYHFFMAMYHSTQRMPPSYQHIIKNRLFNEVSQAEGKLLDISNQQQRMHAVQSQLSFVQQQPYYQTLHPPPANSSSSRPSPSASYYSDGSRLSPSDMHLEQDNYSTASNRQEFIDMINNFTDK